MDFENREFRAEQDQEALLSTYPLAGDAAVRPENIGRACNTIVPVILSGGSGSRLWPYSTEETPKQFLSFTGSRSLFQMTLDRVRDRNRFAAPIVVGNLRHASLCERELTQQDEGAQLLLEPCARNTAAAIALAASEVRESHGDDALLLIMPSDHVIQDVPCFHAAVATGERAARAGRLVTFGIQPTAPETGFGYIEVGEDLPGTAGVKTVERFVEKPPVETAERMVAGGNHVWNAGIFLFRAGTFLDELRVHAPEIAAAAELAVARAKRDGDRIVPDLAALSQSPSESVDYAVMEHSALIAVVPMAPGWSDLGSWDALAELVTQPEPLGPITVVDCDDCYIRSDGLQVAALGVRDLIIVASGQRLLILPRGRSQEVKKLLSAMDSIAA
jgi:mannose-1-phosphate guanylyltransferase/mannose-1-phosphate guanylyltransferase/mannose-6-phosphate isomerase